MLPWMTALSQKLQHLLSSHSAYSPATASRLELVTQLQIASPVARIQSKGVAGIDDEPGTVPPVAALHGVGDAVFTRRSAVLQFIA